MNWLTLTLLAAVLVLVYHLYRSRRNYNYGHEGQIVIAGTIVALAIVCLTLAWVSIVEFEPTMRKLTTVRKAVDALECHASEDALGQAMQWNMRIVDAQFWNAHWLGDPFFHDGVDTVSKIVIPTCK